jgi:acyl carrier protein
LSTEQTIKQILAETLGVDASAITDTFSNADAELWDSLNTLRLVTALEQAFGIRFEMTEIVTMNSYGNIRTAVAKHVDG